MKRINSRLAVVVLLFIMALFTIAGDLPLVGAEASYARPIIIPGGLNPNVASAVLNSASNGRQYIKDIRISFDKDEEVARQIASQDNYTIVHTDLDKDASPYHMFMSVLYGEGKQDAITDVCVMSGGLVQLGAWQQIAHFGTSDYYCLDLSLNQVKDQSKWIFLLFTKDPKKPPLTEIIGAYYKDEKDFQYEDGPWESINYANSRQVANFNKDAGGPRIFLKMTRDFSVLGK